MLAQGDGRGVTELAADGRHVRLERAPEHRSDGWVAEACRPDGACERAEADSPEDALLALTVQLREM
jgi:hypothetical protein